MKQPFWMRQALLRRIFFIVGIYAMTVTLRGATIVWNAASGTDTNWSNGANWLGGVAPGGGDDVKFFDLGTVGAQGVPDSYVDPLFAGVVGSLQLGNTNGSHTILIASGQTLTVTNGGLTNGTPADPGAAKNFTNTITGAGATLVISNAAANIAINQCTAASGADRANLDLSGLDNFIVNANRIGIGDGQLPGVPLNNHVGGNFILAKTNSITLAYTDTLAHYQTNNKSSAIEISRNTGNNPAIISLLQLGISNVFNLDSINIGMDKSGNNSAPAHGVMMFNPAFINKSPTAIFYGIGGPGARVSWWSVGDGDNSASTSNGGGGTNDFSIGSVNAFVNIMSLARDAASSSDSWAGPHKGVFIYTNGTVDVNTLYIGNQIFESGTSSTACMGIFDVGGAGAVLNVNTLMTLGYSTLATAAGSNTVGLLNVTNGSVYASNISVGTYSISNTINLSSGTLIVTNALATNASGLFALNIANSTLGLKITSDGGLKALVKTFNSTGTANQIQLDSSPVIFSSYPQQFPLVKYTTWTGANNFSLAGVPAWAPGATLVSNGPNKSLDLLLPFDPRPVFSAQPIAYSGSPGDNIPTNFSVTVSANSVTPISYQWYYSDGSTTNALANGSGPSGASTLSGVTTANLQIANAQPGDNGNYFVIASNVYGISASSQALLTISSGAIAPNVTGPGAVAATNGITTGISDVVSGSPVPSLQWYFNGSPLGNGPGPSGGSTISGAGTSQLVISNPQYPGDQGTFTLIASNSAGLATNSTFLTVYVPPGISSQPTSLVVTNGNLATLAVGASGMPSPSFQWFKNGTPISSGINPTATNATLSIGSVSPSDTAIYYVQVSNAAGSTNSTNVTVTVNSASMAVASLSPANGAAGVCYDTPLYLTFNQAPTLRTAGKIQIFNIKNTAAPVDTIDLSQGALQSRTIATEAFNTYPVIISGNTAAIYPHLDLLTTNQTYYLTVDDGVFADNTGAYFAGITNSNTWQFATKSIVPANPTNLVVAQDFSGDFATVQGALDSIPANNSNLVYINVRDGLYTEVVEFKKSNIVLRGQSRNSTIIGYANNATLNPSTHMRMAMKMNANNIALDNLTITNMTAQDFSQAEALMIETAAQQILVNNCNVDSYQDTILANTSTSKAYFNRSLIQGDIDFIWGGGNLFFTNCEVRWLIRANNTAALGPNPSPTGSDFGSNGFAFVNCALTTLPGANPADNVGRTRGITNGNTALINCFVSTNIGGWAADALPTNNFRNWYFGCTNDFGAPVTLSNGIPLSANDPNVALAGSATAWLYGWQPALSPNIIGQPTAQSISAGGTATFTVSATGVPDPAYQWFKDGNPVAGATNATLTISNAMRANGGNYSVTVSNLSGTLTSSTAALSYIGNVPPTVNPLTVYRPAGMSLQIPIAGELATNWSDADGDMVSLTGPINSTNGANVSYDSASVSYSNASNVNDQINYDVNDGQGGTTPGIINVIVSFEPVAGAPTVVSVGNSGVNLSVAGVPTYQYEIQRSTNLINWTTLYITNAPASGLIQYVDGFGDLGGNVPPAAFYRTMHPE